MPVVNVIMVLLAWRHIGCVRFDMMFENRLWSVGTFLILKTSYANLRKISHLRKIFDNM